MHAQKDWSVAVRPRSVEEVSPKGTSTERCVTTMSSRRRTILLKDAAPLTEMVVPGIEKVCASEKRLPS